MTFKTDKKANGRNIGLIVMVLFTVFILSTGCSALDFKKKDEIQTKMAAYLEKEYGMEFIVERPKLSGNEGIGYSAWSALAHPKNNEEMEFVVGWRIGDPGEYLDDFLTIKWETEGKIALQTRLDELYGEGNSLVWSVWYFGGEQKELKEYSYPDVLDYGNPYDSRGISYFVFTDAIDKGEEAEKAYTILKQFANRGNAKIFSMFVLYIPFNNAANNVNKIVNMTKNKAVFVENLVEKSMIKNAISISVSGTNDNQLNNYDSVQDIESSFIK